MKIRNHLLSLILLLSATLTQAQHASYNVLFVGNSYTSSNNLPNILTQLFTAGGDTLTHNSSTPGGHRFQQHSTNTTTLNYLAQGTYDFVVLQEQSQIPSFSPAQVQTDCYPYAKILVDSARAGNPCVEPVFYMTWGRKYGDQSNCQFLPSLCTYWGMQDRLRSSYLEMATDNNCTVSPVGMAFAESRLQDSTLNLYTGDNSHPSYAGSYLAACVFYATLLRRTPHGLNYYGNLDSTTATHLQAIAEKVVRDSADQWRIGASDVRAAFTIDTTQAASGSISIQETSQNATSWFWDFGNGSTDTLPNPTVVYSGNGTYTVTLIVENSCQSDTLTDSVTIVLVALQDPLENRLELYPNPGSGALQLRLETPLIQQLELKVWNTLGKKVLELQEKEVPAGTWQQTLDLQNLPKGNYFIELTDGKQKVSRRILLR